MTLNSFLLNHTLWSLMIRFFINSVVLFVIIRVIYYRFSRKEEYLFFYSLTGIMIFLLCSILGSIQLQVGLALGLFAVFAIIRFRTVAFSVKDMTYMFIIIGISIINSQANIPPPVVGAVVVNFTIIMLTFALEKFMELKALEKRNITINRIDLLRPEFHLELLKELSLMTGQNVIRVNVERIDYDRCRAELEIFFKGERLRYVPGEVYKTTDNISASDDFVKKDIHGKEKKMSQ